jgi:hypothetical protein
VLGRPGAGSVHRIVHRVASTDALAFWANRLASEGVSTMPASGSVRFGDPEGLEHELVVTDAPDAPVRAKHPTCRPSTLFRDLGGARLQRPRPLGSAARRPAGRSPHRGPNAAEGRFELRGEHRSGWIALAALRRDRATRARAWCTTSPGTHRAPICRRGATASAPPACRGQGSYTASSPTRRTFACRDGGLRFGRRRRFQRRKYRGATAAAPPRAAARRSAAAPDVATTRLGVGTHRGGRQSASAGKVASLARCVFGLSTGGVTGSPGAAGRAPGQAPAPTAR